MERLGRPAARIQLHVAARHNAAVHLQFNLHFLGCGSPKATHLRDNLDDNGFDKVKIVASSGFDVDKCKVMASVDAPIDVIGTGSFLPEIWPETYATADIIAYDGEPAVKLGREFLLRKT